jgi:type VI secretion system protein VasJ
LVTELNREFYLQLAEPFAGDAPTGVDAKGSDELGLLDDELIKAEGLNIQSVEWDKVERLAAGILAEKSKDLKVAGYLITALYEQYGFAGLATGFQLYGDMVNADYWPELHPQRGKIKKQNKARASSFAWPIFRLDRVLQTFEVSEDSDFEQLLDAAKAFAHADGALYDRLENEAPDCSDARNRFKRMAQDAKAWLDEAKSKAEPEPVKAPEPVKQSVTQRVKEKAKEVVESVKEAFVPPAETMICVSKDDVDKALGSSRKTIESVVSALRSGAEHDPMSFFLARTAVWMTLDELPPDGIMPANPTEQQWADLEVMANNQHHQALIETGEKLFSQGAIFHIGLHRLIANSLDAVGAKEASHMVKICVGHLVQRLPGFMSAKFNNKQPFVDELSKNWLDSAGVLGGGMAGSKNNTGQSNGADVTTSTAPWSDGLTKATELLSTGDFDGGIAVLANGIAAALGLRERTFWQLAQARFCDSAGHVDLALSQLQYLEGFVNDSLLAQWEPQLRIDIITELLKCHVKKMAKLNYTAEQKQALAPLYSELSLKAPVVALSIIIN